MSNSRSTRLSRTLTTGLFLLAGMLVAGCGSGSGASTSTNPVTANGVVSNYNGPAPLTADVQAFKINEIRSFRRHQPGL
jgi:hypothetical protein